MKRHPFIDSIRYHLDLARRIEDRRVRLERAEIKNILKALGFDVDCSNLTESFGTISRTYLTPDLAIKIRDAKNSKNAYQFLGGKIASDLFSKTLPVVKVLAYDHFEKTRYEVLIMERGEGKLLLDDFLYLPHRLQERLFNQILDIAQEMAKKQFSEFRSYQETESFPDFSSYLSLKINGYCQSIIEQKICDKNDIETIKQYATSQLSVFRKEKSYFIHSDLHIGNALYNGRNITLVYDFDSAIQGPRYMMLPKLISTIDNISVIIEGTDYMSAYSDRKFENLYPGLRQRYDNVLSDKDIYRKMNIVFIMKGLRWIASNWSEEWNKAMIKDILQDEIAQEESALNQTYYGQILKKMNVLRK